MMGFDETRADAQRWARMVESAVGAHLWNSFVRTNVEATYWRERGVEVDFVLQRGSEIVALEVKSGAPRNARSGLQAFRNEFAPKAAFLIGSGGMPLEDFFQESLIRIFQECRIKPNLADKALNKM